MPGTQIDQFASSLQLATPRFRSPARRAGRGRGEGRATTPRSRGAGISLALRRLEREHVALLLALCELESPSVPEAGVADTPAMREALRVLLRDDLARVQHALAQAADGRYGRCEDCAQPLSRRSLELRPTTTRCEACAGLGGHGFAR